MGIRDLISSTAESIKKRNAPNWTPVERAYRTSSDYCSAAVSKIDNVVRADGRRILKQYWPDSDSRAKIGLYATTFAKNAGVYALHEGYKSIPGGNAVGKIVSQTIRDMRSGNQETMQMKLDKPEKNDINARKPFDQTDRLEQEVELGSQRTPFSASVTNEDEPPLQFPDGDKSRCIAQMKEEVQLKGKEMQEGISDTKPKSTMSIQSAKRLSSLEESSNEHGKGPAPASVDKKKMFIRSRL